MGIKLWVEKLEISKQLCVSVLAKVTTTTARSYLFLNNSLKLKLILLLDSCHSSCLTLQQTSSIFTKTEDIFLSSAYRRQKIAMIKQSASWFFYSLFHLFIIYNLHLAVTHYYSTVLILSAPPDVVMCFLLGNKGGGKIFVNPWNLWDTVI